MYNFLQIRNNKSMETNNRHIGQTIKSLREFFGLSLSELSHRLSMTEFEYIKLEKGRSVFTSEILSSLTDVYVDFAGITELVDKYYIELLHNLLQNLRNGLRDALIKQRGVDTR